MAASVRPGAHCCLDSCLDNGHQASGRAFRCVAETKAW
jgi:hypothetical protein